MPPSPKPTGALAIAATLRAAGETWDIIGDKVHRSAERVRRWPRLYAREWSHYFQLAETHLLADAAIEARLTLRQLLRSKQEKTQLAASQTLLKIRQHDRTLTLPSEQVAPSSEDEAMKAFLRELESMTDEELEAAQAEADARCGDQDS